MVTKYFCDICEAMTKNHENVRIQERPTKIMRDHDVCDACLCILSSVNLSIKLGYLKNKDASVEVIIEVSYATIPRVLKEPQGG